jgi:hypothetical protein
MFKKISWVVALIAVFAMVFMGCPSGSKIEDDVPGQKFVYTFKGDGSEYTPALTNKPTIESGFLNIQASSSTGFSIDFSKIGYTYNATDILIFTYQVEVEIPEAVLTLKNPASWSDDMAGDSDWGKGKGREYALGNATHSTYDGPKVAGTWDAATNTGTFEVLMKYLRGATAIGFQHNFWADFPGSPAKVAENSKYKLKFLKVENAVGDDTEPEPPEAAEWYYGEVVFDLDDWFTDNEIEDGEFESSFPSPFQKAGSPTITAAGGALVISDRSQNWEGVDIQMNALVNLGVDITTGVFKLVVTGTSGASSGIKLAQPNNPWGTLATADDDAAFTLTYIIPADYEQSAIRIQADVDEDYTITGVVITYEGTYSFYEAEGLTTGIGSYGSGTHSFADGVLIVSGNGGFSVDFPVGATKADTIEIDYVACLVSGTEAKFVRKQGSGWTDLTPASYPSLDTTGEEATLDVVLVQFSSAGLTAQKAFFQTNGNNFGVAIKIIEVRLIEGEAITTCECGGNWFDCDCTACECVGCEEPPNIILDNYDADFDFTTVGITDTVVGLFEPTSDLRWEITDETTPTYAALADATKLVLVLDNTEDTVFPGYVQIAVQYLLESEGAGGKGWTTLSVFGGGGFDEVGSDATYDATNKVVTITLDVAALGYLTDKEGLVVFINGTNGLYNFEVIAAGFIIED